MRNLKRYRVLRCQQLGEVFFSIRTVQHNAAGGCDRWDGSDVLPDGETALEFKADLQAMLAAFDEPVLEEREHPLRLVPIE